MAGFTIKQVKANLVEWGMPAENVDKAAEALCGLHNTVLDAIKEERDALKGNAETLAELQKRYDALANDGFKERYEKEHEAFEAFKAQIAQERTDAQKREAFKAILADAHITKESAIAKVLKYTDLSQYELGEDGKFKTAKDILKAVEAEWPEYVEKEGKEGTPIPTPPESHDGEFEKMSLMQKMEYANQHPNDEAVKAWLKK